MVMGGCLVGVFLGGLLGVVFGARYCKDGRFKILLIILLLMIL